MRPGSKSDGTSLAGYRSARLAARLAPPRSPLELQTYGLLPDARVYVADIEALIPEFS